MRSRFVVGFACGLAVVSCSRAERQFGSPLKVDAASLADGGGSSGASAVDSGADELTATGQVETTVPDEGTTAPASAEAGVTQEMTQSGADAGEPGDAASEPADAGADSADAACADCPAACDSNPCENGGVCQVDGEGFICECAAGFSGETCGVNIDDCSPNPCRHDGTCVDEVAGYHCECPPGYGGPNCEDVLTWCDQQRRPSGVATYSCVDFEDGIPIDWVAPEEGNSKLTSERYVSAPQAWYSEASSTSKNGALTHNDTAGDIVQSATLEAQLRVAGLPGPVADYAVRLMCIEVGQGEACVISNGLQGLRVQYIRNTPAVSGGSCESELPLQLGSWQSLRLVLNGDTGAISFQIGGTEALKDCTLGTNLHSGDAVFRVGMLNPSALAIDAFVDNVRAWTVR